MSKFVIKLLQIIDLRCFFFQSLKEDYSRICFMVY